MSAADLGPDELTGERATTLVTRSVSIQSRLSNILAVSLMTVLGLGALIWYYANKPRGRRGCGATFKARRRIVPQATLCYRA